jgi:hypothetical protein
MLSALLDELGGTHQRLLRVVAIFAIVAGCARVRFPV